MKGYCPNCDKEVILREERRKETYPVKGEEITIDATVCVCSECNEDVWDRETDDANLDMAYNIYRKRHGLLSPEEIKCIREKYGVSQATFAKILGFGEKTITRYENGRIQDEAPNNLILIVKDPSCFMKLFRRSMGKLTDAEIRQIESKRITFTQPVAMKYRSALEDMGYRYVYEEATTIEGGQSAKEKEAV
ncbi:MAG TPA: type II toxin-antitoxin system MqsA family antitoxin [Alphaproteobacteria bacterium]|nr:type II toxin-antitoxin system MqsA family antitoxin [Alphaproteobacteria bacterium]